MGSWLAAQLYKMENDVQYSTHFSFKIVETTIYAL